MDALIRVTSSSRTARSRLRAMADGAEPVAARARIGVSSPEELADLLVGLDPRWGDTRVLEHVECEPRLPGVRVVVVWERFALVGKVVELALLHRLADLAVDQRLPVGADLHPAVGAAPMDERLVVGCVGHVDIFARR